jgi:hypothetical protein
MYFKEFPLFLYDFRYGDYETKTHIVKDITRNVRFRKEVLENIALYDEYDIVDGETPEIVAEKVYGDPEYHWIIMLANQRFDYLNDWPLSDYDLQNAAKYVFNPTITASSWVYSSGTVTVTAPLHGLLVNPTTIVTIMGSTIFDETPHTITAVTDNTFTFSVSSAPSSTSGDSLTINTQNRENYIRHYENAAGFVVNSNSVGAVPITNLSNFQDENELKRRIKLISPRVINTILNDYKELL